MTLNPRSCAFLFPGQGSQTLGMGLNLAKTHKKAAEVFLEADEILGFYLSKLCWYGPLSDLNKTVNTQPALLVHSTALLNIIKEKFPAIRPNFVAGHSMGQISALVAAGSISFPDALRLARKRGELMKKAGEQKPGGMAAIMGIDINDLEEICRIAGKDHEIVQIANDNCPGQVVISGSRPAIDRAIRMAYDAGARRAVNLAVSIAAHSPLMASVQSEFNQAVADTAIVDPSVPVMGNVSALPLTSAETVRVELRSQLTKRVRWKESMDYLLDQDIRFFLEIGPGSVLIGLLKRIDREITGLSLGTWDDFENINA